MLTLSDALAANAVKWPDAVCLADAHRQFTFSELNARTSRLANGLISMGVRPGDAIAVYARNSIEYMEIFHVAARLGMRLVTLNFWLRTTEMAVLLDHSEARFLVIGESAQHEIVAHRALFSKVEHVLVIGNPVIDDAFSWASLMEAGDDADPAIVVDPQAPFWMMYTSGTTGNPKGLHRSFQRTAMCIWAGIIEFGYTRNDRILALSPFFHGVHFMPLMVLQAGGGIYIEPEFKAARVLETIERQKITATFMVPTMLNLLMQEPRFEETDFSALRSVVTGGAALSTATKTCVMEVMGPVLHEFYGASESGFITVLHPEDQWRKERCCGQPCFGAEVQIRDELGHPLRSGEIGEVFSRCEGRFDAYYKDEARTAAVLDNGWFTAGDLGRMDDEGFVYIVDRKSDLIISGGENVYPREIEDVLSSHPGILECAVVGMPDPVWGETVVAVVVPAGEGEPTPKR
nr:AMP-binding protein [Marinicella sp. W31]MDC2878974.1 AMP-binding protein [Marinicella sp. W31]